MAPLVQVMMSGRTPHSCAAASTPASWALKPPMPPRAIPTSRLSMATSEALSARPFQVCTIPEIHKSGGAHPHLEKDSTASSGGATDWCGVSELSLRFAVSYPTVRAQDTLGRSPTHYKIVGEIIGLNLLPIRRYRRRRKAPRVRMKCVIQPSRWRTIERSVAHATCSSGAQTWPRLLSVTPLRQKLSLRRRGIVLTDLAMV